MSEDVYLHYIIYILDIIQKIENSKKLSSVIAEEGFFEF